MLQWIVMHVGPLTTFRVGLLMAIENIVLPLPSELIMPLAGALTNSGQMTLWGVVLAGTIGSVVGGYPLYAMGWIFGRERLTAWIDRHGKWLLLRRGDVEKAKQRFDDHGVVAVFFSQLVPGLRGLISIPAGFAHMNVLLFTAANFAGTLLWCLVLALIGRELGAHFAAIHRVVGPTGWIAIGGLILGGTGWLVARRHKRMTGRRARSG